MIEKIEIVQVVIDGESYWQADITAENGDTYVRTASDLVELAHQIEAEFQL